jgi:hypothetical protein
MKLMLGQLINKLHPEYLTVTESAENQNKTNKQTKKEAMSKMHRKQVKWFPMAKARTI